MENTPIPNEPIPTAHMRKACQISLMFPVEDDADALSVKAAIDAVIHDVKDKRYTFNITEM